MTEETKNLVEVPLADLLRVLPFKGTDDVRYYLNGVLVTPYEDHALLVATNGHWMALFESANAHTDKDRILDLPDWFAKQLMCLDPKRIENFDSDDPDAPRTSMAPPISYGDADKYVRVLTETSRLIVGPNGLEDLVKPCAAFIDGKFPDWRKVIPDPKTLQRGLFTSVSPHYLATIHEAIPNEREHGLYCFQNPDNPSAPIVFRFGNLPQMVVVLMPRLDDGNRPAGWPKWMMKAETEAA